MMWYTPSRQKHSQAVLPSLNPDNMIKLDFDKINGTYKVYKIDTTLNNYGGPGQGSKIVVKAI